MSAHAPFDPAFHGHLIPKQYHDQLVAKAETPGPLEQAFDFEGVLTRQQMVEVEDLRKALRDLEEAIWAEEARMRREVLPTPPEGWRWASQLFVSDVDQLSGDYMRVRLIFRLVEV